MLLSYKRLNNRSIYCPNCKSELLFHGRALEGTKDYLYCNNLQCFRYYNLDLKTKELTELGSFQVILNQLEDMGLANGPGIPTSIAYRPWIIKVLDKLKGTKDNNSK